MLILNSGKWHHNKINININNNIQNCSTNKGYKIKILKIIIKLIRHILCLIVLITIIIIFFYYIVPSLDLQSFKHTVNLGGMSLINCLKFYAIWLYRQFTNWHKEILSIIVSLLLLVLPITCIKNWHNSYEEFCVNKKINTWFLLYPN